ncbi:MAG: divalent-cation tolerance protein CutA [Candidatus Solibacter usitatus]|nr:divalent-cation tolerance protein CutA [Candidatus Solibacter usitatus]
MTDKIVVISTCASFEEATRIARHLVDSRVAACVTITPGVRSIYRWKGAVEDSEEFALTIKSRRDLFESLCAELRKVHSYEVPEILALAVVDGAPSYLDWLDRELVRPEETET